MSSDTEERQSVDDKDNNDKDDNDSVDNANFEPLVPSGNEDDSDRTVEADPVPVKRNKGHRKSKGPRCKYLWPQRMPKGKGNRKSGEGAAGRRNPRKA